MPDVFTKSKRSEVMSRIRSRGNKDTELAMMKVFREHHMTGWRRHLQLRIGAAVIQQKKREGGKVLKVRPDFVFRKERVAVFVDGCFWHGCVRCYVRPKQNRKFWDAKFATNVARDRRVNRALKVAGWTVVRVWEHELAVKNAGRLRRKLEKVLSGS